MADFKNSHGVVFKFNNQVYTATGISVSYGGGEVDATSLNIGTQAGSLTRYRYGGLSTPASIKVDWLGAISPPTDNLYAFAFEGTASGSTAPTNFGAGASGSALATGVSITASAGELIKGTATFKF